MTENPTRLMELLTRAKALEQPIVLMGIGNEFRGDDAIGHLLAQELDVRKLPGLASFAVGVSIENATHLVAKHGAKVLILVDAVSNPERPLGEWGFFEPDTLDSFIHSTHSVPLSLFVAYWKREIPGLDVHFIGINIHGTATFKAVSPEIVEVQARLADLFTDALRPAR